MHSDKRFVYILRSLAVTGRYYTGLTSDVPARLDAHNAGRCPHTVNGRPWRIDVVVEFADENRAAKFERYLKSGSGVPLRSAIYDEVHPSLAAFDGELPTSFRPGSVIRIRIPRGAERGAIGIS